jgi:hypothetical protein
MKKKQFFPEAGCAVPAFDPAAYRGRTDGDNVLHDFQALEQYDELTRKLVDQVAALDAPRRALVNEYRRILERRTSEGGP